MSERKAEPEIPDLETGLQVFCQTVRSGNVSDIGQLAITLIQTSWACGFTTSRKVSHELFRILVKETRRKGEGLVLPLFIAHRKSPIGVLFANGIATLTDIHHRPIRKATR